MSNWALIILTHIELFFVFVNIELNVELPITHTTVFWYNQNHKMKGRKKLIRNFQNFKFSESEMPFPNWFGNIVGVGAAIKILKIDFFIEERRTHTSSFSFDLVKNSKKTHVVI